MTALTVTAEAAIVDHGTVMTFTAADGTVFVADKDVALVIIEIVKLHGELEVEVESWQIRGRPTA